MLTVALMLDNPPCLEIFSKYMSLFLQEMLFWIWICSHSHGCNTWWYFVGNWHDKLTVKGILDVISKVYLMLDRRCLNLSIFNSTKGSVVIGLKGVERYVHWGGHASKIDGYRNQESLRNWTMMLKECSLVSLGEGILIDSLMN